MRAIGARAQWSAHSPSLLGHVQNCVRDFTRAASRQTTTEAADDLPDDHDWDAAQRVAGMDLVDDHVLQAHSNYDAVNATSTANAAWNDLRYDSRTPGAPSLVWPANTGSELVRHNLPPQSLWALDTMRTTALRRRHTWKKLALQELSTGLLIQSLIRRAVVTRFPKVFLDPDLLSSQLWNCAAMTELQAQEARDRVLRSMEIIHQTPVDSLPDEIAAATQPIEQPVIPNYFQDIDGDFHAICQQMNESIRQLFEQIPKGNDRAEAIAITKICHNLLVSTAPPDLQTFNILLIGFKRMCRPRLVDSCIAAFYSQKIRPNEITCREIMSHYTHERRPNEFSRFVAKMRGVGDALMLANPAIIINEASSRRIVKVGEDKLYQKVHPTPIVFGSLISGVLKFAGFDRALDIYYEMKADSWGLDIPTLTRLLEDCLRRADWEGGIYVWEEINSIKESASTQDMTKAYYHMLSLCSITGNTAAFNQVLNEIAKRGLDRKSIIAAAMTQTRRMQKQSEYLAPAWAADNVLIAVSDYLGDAKTSDDSIGSVHNSSYDAVLQDNADTYQYPSTHSTREAWASWVEHEFGEKSDPEL